ncbi:hypothetical protein [uncultured Alistipes sp.]|uniref:hypothetical protein n=1 Tax=uncultured Alistipes sp. TaxID=538949 RepID=UPI00266559E7|nr:hypothetical protein [uncultured Alistipes sp.]
MADTIRRAGSITFAEINERWQRSTLSGGKRFALRTFHNHREAIEELFGIRIACDERTNRYYITNSDDLQRDSMANWLLDSFSVSNMLRDTQSLRSRILKFSDLYFGGDAREPADRRYLPAFLRGHTV